MTRASHRWRSLGSAYVPPRMGPSHRSFGITVGTVLAGIAALSMWRGHVVRAEIVGAVAAVLIVVALARPASLARLARIWSRIGHVLGAFNSRVLLTLMFALLFVPVGWMIRLFAQDPLDRRKSPASRWLPYPDRLRDPKHYEHLF